MLSTYLRLWLITGRTEILFWMGQLFCRGFCSNCIRNCLSLSTFCEILMEIIVYALNKPAEQSDRQTDSWQNSRVYIGQWLSGTFAWMVFVLVGKTNKWEKGALSLLTAIQWYLEREREKGRIWRALGSSRISLCTFMIISNPWWTAVPTPTVRCQGLAAGTDSTLDCYHTQFCNLMKTNELR